MNKLVSIQYVRALAAFAVVFHHLRNPAPWLWNPFERTEFGNAGVMVFFVVSGYVMHVACRNGSALQFLWRRFARVVPFYWLMTTAAFAYLGLGTLLTNPASAEWAHLFQSYAFVPHFSPRHPEMIWPVLIPGWTLNFEVFFFVLFALGIALGRASLFATAAVLVLFVSGLVVRPQSAVWITYTSHLMLLFAGGMTLGWISERVSMRPVRWLALPALIGLGLASFKMTANDHDALFFLSSLALVAAAVGWEEAARASSFRVGELLGDASYSIYLTHPFVYPPTLSLLKHLPLSGMWQFVAVMALALAVCAVAGVAVHVLVEKRLIAATKDLPETFTRVGISLNRAIRRT